MKFEAFKQIVKKASKYSHRKVFFHKNISKKKKHLFTLKKYLNSNFHHDTSYMPATAPFLPVPGATPQGWIR